MPDISSGSYIGAVPSYGPRSQAALRRLGSVGGADLYGEDEEMPGDLAEYIRSSGMDRAIVSSGTARSSTGGAPYAIVNGQKIYMTEGGGTATADPGEYTWSRSRQRTINTDRLANSQGYRDWAATKARTAEADAASKRKVEEVRALRKLDREFEDPNAAALRAMQLRLMEAQVKREEEAAAFAAREASGTLTSRQRELDSRDRANANKQAQAIYDQVKSLESSGDPRKIRQAAALRQEFAKRYSGSDVALAGATTNEAEAIQKAMGSLAPEIEQVVKAYVAPLAERESKAYGERSGFFGGAFTPNSTDPLTYDEMITMRQNLAAEAQDMSQRTGVPAQQIFDAMLRKAGMSVASHKMRPDRASEIMTRLRGPWNDGKL